jgi:ABC-type glycerol-3-phosphate transport system permease component
VARRARGGILATLGHRALILGFTAFAIFPFYWMLITASKQNADFYWARPTPRTIRSSSIARPRSSICRSCSTTRST